MEEKEQISPNSIWQYWRNMDWKWISLFFGEYPFSYLCSLDKTLLVVDSQWILSLRLKPCLLSTPEMSHCTDWRGAFSLEGCLCFSRRNKSKRYNSSSPSPEQFQSALFFSSVNSQGIYFYTVQFRWIAEHFTLFSNDVWVFSSSLIKPRIQDPSFMWFLVCYSLSYCHYHH